MHYYMDCSNNNVFSPFSFLNSDFSVNFGEVFTIQIVQWPESIKLQVFESKLIASNVIAEIYIPIPDMQETVKSSVGTEQYQFTSNKVVTFPHSAIGSGLFFCVHLYYGVKWSSLIYRNLST